jgi:predicted dehydrogenase
MRKINLGIAGYGKMGKIREDSFKTSSEVNLVAIFDNNEDLSHTSLIVCRTFDDLLACNVDAVFVAAYVNVAADYVARALEAGKHVFCEKPPSMNREELNRIEEIQKNSNLVLKYGFNHRSHYSVMEAKKIINKGTMGKLLWMRGVYGKAGSLDFHQNWRNYKEYSGGGILMDQGIHMLDLFRYFSNDEFECLSSTMDTIYWDIESEDNAFLTLRSKKGVISTLHSTANQWRHKFLLEMTFEKGYINLDGILSSTGSYAPEKLIYGYRELEDPLKEMGKPTENLSYFENDDSWYLELVEFVEAIAGNKKIKNGNLNDAIEIMTLVDKIYNKSKEVKEEKK